MCTTCDPNIHTDGETMGFIRGAVAEGADKFRWQNGDYMLIGNGFGSAAYWVYQTGAAFIVVPIAGSGSSGGGTNGSGPGGLNLTSGGFGSDDLFNGGCDIVNPTFWDNC